MWSGLLRELVTTAITTLLLPMLAIALDTNDADVKEGYLSLDEPELWDTGMKTAS